MYLIEVKSYQRVNSVTAGSGPVGSGQVAHCEKLPLGDEELYQHSAPFLSFCR